MLAVKVPLKGINEVKNILIKINLLNKYYKIKTDGNYGLIAIKTPKNLENLENKINENLKMSKIKDLNKSTVKIENIGMEPFKKEPRSLSEQLKGKLNEDEIKYLKTSFDIIGDLVLLEIPKNLEKHKEVIGNACIDFTNTKSAFMKKSGIKGVIRTREIERIAGEDNSRTIAKEHGVKISLDLKQVYFSPRLATERKRVEKQAKNGEKILDMFTGVGPLPILIAKNKNVEIYGVDINKIAIEYFKENIKINKLNDHIYPIFGDINDVALKFKEKGLKFNRIIMNLPETAYKFLDLSIYLLSDNGILHYYEFSGDYEILINRIKQIAIIYNREIEVLNMRKVKSSSPGRWIMGVDVKIK
ncbi:MAG: class I SAM-dependent methyltransferase family protein [Methanobrevibacter sp.]|jgi:tRNA (guanine37-N1)-methyltransferase|nr:class I SAM-dependent methyltransferase family protein [Methanobrevibacter sp.]